MRRALSLLAPLGLVLGLAAPAAAAVTEPCPGDPLRPDRLIGGEFESTLQGGYVLVPFDVPAGTTAVRVKYCFDQPDAPATGVRHTLDLGLYEPLRAGDTLPGAREFRGWGGSSHPDVTLSAEGFSSEAQYLAAPRGHVPGATTRGFRPGPIRPGRWSAELGLAAIAGPALGDSDGRVGWRVEVELASDPAFADAPYRRARYSPAPVRRRPGWYTGDLHVHAEHSALGDATMTETFDHAFGAAGLDFLTLTDYVTDSAWGEIGRHQSRRRGALIGRSSEVITYRGHTNNQLSGDYVDYRTGPVYDLRPDGGVSLRRAARPVSRVLHAVRRGGGFTQINHPTIFPASNPLFAILCRGCSWEYSAGETDYALVDAIEVNTGPQKLGEAPNPFTATAIEFYERALAAGAHAAAVASSDSHHAGDTPGGVTQSPVGVGATAVYARELSESGLRCAVQAGHTYAKLGGPRGPDLRLRARAPGARRRAIFGDAVRGRRLALIALAPGASADSALQLVRTGRVIRTGRRKLRHTARRSGRYGLRLVRGTITEAVGTPVSFTRRDGRGRVAVRDCRS